MKRLAVIGGGAAGVLVIVQLARRLPPDAEVEVVLFDDSNRVARGAAYSTTDDRHLLNVPAARMSAVDGDDEHFLRWLRRTEPEADAEDYRPRRVYGDYLAQCLATHARACRLVVRHARVTDLVRSAGRWWVGHERGSDVVDAVVLALGHSAPRAVPAFGRDADDFVADPWSPGALDRLLARTGAADLVVTIGTGLTAVDVALPLLASGRRVIAVSRHGLLPAGHRPTMPIAVPLDVPARRSLTVAELEALVTSHVESVVAAGGDWRSAVDGLRPVTADLWRRLSSGERSAFLAGPARRWETVRHRMAPVVADDIRRHRGDGRFEVRNGELLAALCSPGRSVLTVRGTSGSLSRIVASVVVNCTGPTCDIERYPGGFGHRLVERGLVRRDPLGLGIDTSDDGFAIDAAGDVDRSLAVVGALRRGSLYESTAIPELRSQAAAITASLVVQPKGAARVISA